MKSKNEQIKRTNFLVIPGVFERTRMKKRDLVFPNLGKYNFQRISEEIRVDEDSKYSEEEKPFQREMHLNKPNKYLFRRNSSNSKKKLRTKGHDREVVSSLRNVSDQEHRVNALASGAEEGRDKLR